MRVTAVNQVGEVPILLVEGWVTSWVSQGWVSFQETHPFIFFSFMRPILLPVHRYIRMGLFRVLRLTRTLTLARSTCACK
jgi:hypothetical protein